jgi:hypothetical protein
MKAKEFHTRMAECFVKSSKAHRALGQDDLADACADAAECHVGMAKAMASGDDLDKVTPTNAHAVLPDHPMAKLVPRVGQPLVMPVDDDPTESLDKAMGRTA